MAGHLSGVVDAAGVADAAAQRSEVVHHAVKLKCPSHGVSRECGHADDLAVDVDVLWQDLSSAERPEVDHLVNDAACRVSCGDAGREEGRSK
jgi:hypothetical protein